MLDPGFYLQTSVCMWYMSWSERPIQFWRIDYTRLVHAFTSNNLPPVLPPNLQWQQTPAHIHFKTFPQNGASRWWASWFISHHKGVNHQHLWTRKLSHIISACLCLSNSVNLAVSWCVLLLIELSKTSKLISSLRFYNALWSIWQVDALYGDGTITQ